MREILFRGKRVDNGEWVYGYYTELPVGTLGAALLSGADGLLAEDTAPYIINIYSKQHSNFSPAYPLEVVEAEEYEVILETVGEFTGLTDKNGKKIFEGDVVKAKYSTLPKDKYVLCEVVWEEESCAFALYPINEENFGIIIDIFDIKEVVGNVFDDKMEGSK